MELKLNTERALKYEEKTGKDIIEFLNQVAKTNSFKVKDILELYEACGDGYNATTFDAWEGSFTNKAVKIIEAVKEYLQGKNE